MPNLPTIDEPRNVLTRGDLCNATSARATFPHDQAARLRVLVEAVRPNCDRCKHRLPVRNDRHCGCGNAAARVEFDVHGKRNGWANHPTNFDPIWLLSCDGFEPIERTQTSAASCDAVAGRTNPTGTLNTLALRTAIR